MADSKRRKAQSTLKFILQNHVIGADKHFPEELDKEVDEFVDQLIAATVDEIADLMRRGQWGGRRDG